MNKSLIRIFKTEDLRFFKHRPLYGSFKFIINLLRIENITKIYL